MADQFGRFVDTGTTDTLHYIVDRELSESLRGRLSAAEGAPTVHLWHNLWFFFAQRIERQPKNLSELTQSIPEFRNLVSVYYNHCVAPMFDRLQPDLRAKLTERDRSLLNGFQQRHTLFVEQYQAFVDLIRFGG